MESVVLKVGSLLDSEVAEEVAERREEFMKKRESSREVFLELCFCLLTANYKAERSWEIQEIIGEGFFFLSEEELALSLKKLGHRFWPQRAKRIVLARDVMDELIFMLDMPVSDIRQWLVANVKGLGMKEASHFLRNIGFEDIAIIDFHIIDLLEKEGLLERPKSLSVSRYLEVESLLREISLRLGIGLGELDLYLWYLETGKILK